MAVSGTGVYGLSRKKAGIRRTKSRYRNSNHSPLTFIPASPTHAPTLIDNYYTTGVRSSNSSTSYSYDIYIYLSNDNDSDNNLYSLINDQLKILETTGYPISPAGLESATITADTHTSPIHDLDDEPIHSTIHILSSVLTQDLCKFTVNLPAVSPASYGLLLLASRHAK